MKYCNKCQCEYEDFAQVCVDCGEVLVVYEEKIDEANAVDDVDYLRVLKSCHSNEEANLLISLMNHEGIYTNIRYEGAGSYLNLLHGRSYQGVLVLVPSKQYDDAQEVLKDFDYTHHLSKEDFDSKPLRRFKWNKRLLSLFILLSVTISFLVPLILRLISIFQVHEIYKLDL